MPKSKAYVTRSQNYPIHIVNLIAKKRLLAEFYTKNYSRLLGEKLKAAEFELGNAIKDFRMKQWSNFVDSMGPSPLSTIPFWRRINRLRNNSHSKNIASLLISDQLISEDVDKANAFADRLEKIFSNENDERFDSHFSVATNDFV